VLGVAQTDYTPLQRIAGYLEMAGNIKKIKVSTIMERVYSRKAMRQQVEEQTLKHIATYIDKRADMSDWKMFSMIDTNNDGMLTEQELMDGLRAIKVNVNQQLRRILLAIFDHNGDGMISKQEFLEAVAKYSTKKPLNDEEITGNFTKVEKEKLKNFVNEERRTKQVFEENKFDEEDQEVMSRRKQEMIDLIKNNRMPVETINGEIIVRLDNFSGLASIPGKEVLVCVLKQAYIDDKGQEQQRKPIMKLV
jgi:Ca2+-binding EF-hand superfamily protein